MSLKIEAQDLGVSYGDNLIWEHINLTIDQPGLISILGPNGVGKSTFMYTINKILEPTSGRVLLDGKDVMEMTYKDIAKKVAYVPQASGETFAMTVMDTVLMGRYPHSGYSVTLEDLEIAADSLQKMHMGEFAMRNFNELSAGQHQRVMIARGLAQMPELLMLDEPTSNLDIYHQLYTMKLLQELAHERNITVLVICHDLNVAAKFSDRVIMFCKGRVHSDGPAGEILTADTIKDVYGVSSDIIDVDEHPYVIYHSDDIDTGLAPAQKITSIPKDEKGKDGPED
ncbi:MAG: ABC transporter ATP-binding protein [Candidatus Methanomethylophilaceae archaeon]|nr:ABC transporter ATP-binding protein [Candidatus Methanomethylophilaceae archaeon]MBP5685948.1 ABC transporter ATP-binding protein [Candidatus Methanomethylophilaceae archaeon]MBP5735690.1 ABC transporter ATP-binding protein [Candidatus Methanomethylophilaceae archaeon]